MYQVKEKDWKLFRKMLPEWQEAYMERLTKEYIELLSSDMQASDKFWALDKRIKDDMCPPRKNRQKTYAKYRMKRMTNMI